MSLEYEICVLCLLLLGILFTAMGTRSMREFSRHDLAHICKQRNNMDRFGMILRWHEWFIVSLDTCKIILLCTLICLTTVWSIKFDTLKVETIALPISTGIGLLLAYIFIPRSIVHLWGEAFLYFSWPVIWFIGRVMTPLVWIGHFVDIIIHRLAGQPSRRYEGDSIEDEIRSVVTEGLREGVIQGDQKEMIEGVIEMRDADVTEIMTPRTDMISMPYTDNIDEALQFVIDYPHSRIPVYDKNRDNIIGTMHAKDLLTAVAKKKTAEKFILKDILREPYFVPESKAANVILHEFQRTRTHLAIVLDEYGGVSGIVTIEDVLEEIVGEIIDEYDDDLIEGIYELDDHTFEVLARVHLDEVNERLGTTLPDDDVDFDTIGGFIFSELGRIPVVGDTLLWHNFRFTVLEATKRRVEKVKIEVLDEAVVQKDSA